MEPDNALYSKLKTAGVGGWVQIIQTKQLSPSSLIYQIDHDLTHFWTSVQLF